MLKISHTRLLAVTLGCLAIAAASISLAQDQSSSGQANQSPAATQPGASASSQTDAAGGAAATQQQPSTSTTQPGQPASQPDAQSNVQPNAQPNTQSSTEQSLIDSQQPAGQQGKAQRSNASNPRDWPAFERYGSSRPGMNDSRGGRGASLGVSIVADEQGITITRVHPGTPAQQMGIRRGDRITSVNGQSVGATDEFITTVRSMKPGDQVELGIVRDEGQITLNGKLEPYSRAMARGPIASGEELGPRPMRSDRDRSDDLQTTSYEERNRSGRGQSGDVESRLSRIEQQIDRLTRDISEIRTSLQSSQAATSAQPEGSPAGQPNTRGQSPFRPTPGEPPSGLRPQSR